MLLMEWIFSIEGDFLSVMICVFIFLCIRILYTHRTLLEKAAGICYPIFIGFAGSC